MSDLDTEKKSSSSSTESEDSQNLPNLPNIPEEEESEPIIGILALKTKAKIFRSYRLKLEEDILSYYKTKPIKNTEGLNRPHKLVGVIDLHNAWVLNHKNRQCFQIGTTYRKFVFKASTEKKRNEWVGIFLDVLTKLHPERQEKLNKRKYAIMKKEGDHIKSWQTRYFILYDQYLAYYLRKGDTLPLGIIPLDSVTIEEILDMVMSDYVLRIHSTTRRDYSLLPLSEGNDWRTCEKNVVNFEKERYKTTLLDRWKRRLQRESRKIDRQILAKQIEGDKLMNCDGQIEIKFKIKKEMEPTSRMKKKKILKDGLYWGILIDYYLLISETAEARDSLGQYPLIGTSLEPKMDFSKKKKPKFEIKLTNPVHGDITLCFKTDFLMERWEASLKRAIFKLRKLISGFESETPSNEGSLSMHTKIRGFHKYYVKTGEINLLCYKKKEDQNQATIKIPYKNSYIFPYFQKSYSFVIRTNPEMKHHKFQCENKEEYAQWMGILQRRIATTDQADLSTDVEFLMGQNPQLSQEQITELQDISSFKKNELQSLYKKWRLEYKSGRVSKSTFGRFAKKLGVEGEVEKEFLYNGFDQNKNGLLGFDEIVIGLNALIKGNKLDKIEFAFYVYDRDGNKKLTEKEFWYIFCKLQNIEEGSEIGEDIHKLFLRIDKNKNGEIDLEEFKKEAQKDLSFVKCLRLFEIN
ncbi:calcium binding protein [Anaeramoeba flamelloides]|uniref:Calcium binding protein n=1 Tax=Anaeramoeba flamelloides TaxID=1746091 RepID=A0ABQ8Y983_9EUKA|nr:calcium binding protein [Anaeramoeba flamelloides]